MNWTTFARKNNLRLTPFLIEGRYGGRYIRLDGEFYDNPKSVYITMRNNKPEHKGQANQSEITFPDQPDFEDLLNLFAPGGLPDLPGVIETIPEGKSFFYHHKTATTADIDQVQSILDFLAKIASAYPIVMALGGEVVAALQKISQKNTTLGEVAIQLIEDIGVETTWQLNLQADHLLCPNCLIHFASHTIRLKWWKTITYYGCRQCSQSRQYSNSNKLWMVAALDKGTLPERSQKQQVLTVNWSKYRQLFDFDEIQIIQASDEEAERFVVQVGNDTDPVRKARYQHMRCTISSSCNLSENTMRILRRTFGQIEVQEI